MKETIETWARVSDGEILGIYENKESAKKATESFGGTAVKLTGEMPRKPIERKTTAWVQWCEPNEESNFVFQRLGIEYLCDLKWPIECGQRKVEICVRELVEE